MDGPPLGPGPFPTNTLGSPLGASMQLTAAHWVFLAGVVVILATMIMRKNIVVPAVVATFLTALVFTGSLATGLSSDYVIRVAPGLSATAASTDANVVADRAFVLSLVVGGIALAIGYVMELRRMRRPSDEWLDDWETAADRRSLVADAEEIIDEDPLAGGSGVATSSGGGGGATGGPAGPGGRRPTAKRGGEVVR